MNQDQNGKNGDCRHEGERKALKPGCASHWLRQGCSFLSAVASSACFRSQLPNSRTPTLVMEYAAMRGFQSGFLGFGEFCDCTQGGHDHRRRKGIEWSLNELRDARPHSLNVLP